MLLDLRPAEDTQAQQPVTTGEITPILLDGRLRIADLLDANQRKRRLREESLILLGME